MSLKDTWIDKQNTTTGLDGDDILAEDINAIANEVIEQGEKLEKIPDELDKKVDAEDGKGLSSNDFSDEYKEKLDNIQDEFVQSDWDVDDETAPDYIKNRPFHMEYREKVGNDMELFKEQIVTIDTLGKDARWRIPSTNSTSTQAGIIAGESYEITVDFDERNYDYFVEEAFETSYQTGYGTQQKAVAIRFASSAGESETNLIKEMYIMDDGSEVMVEITLNDSAEFPLGAPSSIFVNFEGKVKLWKATPIKPQHIQNLKKENLNDEFYNSLLAGVQSDMEQNDENDPTFIRNRTHYFIKNIIGEAHYTSEDTIPGMFDGVCDLRIPKELVEVGKEYGYTINGKEGTFVFNDSYMEIDGLYGDVYDFGDHYDWQFSLGYGESVDVIFYDGGQLKKLDEKFIPDTIATKEYVKEYVDENSGSIAGDFEMDYEYVDDEIAKLKQYADETFVKKTSGGTGIVNTATGDALKLTDSAYAPIEGLVLYGKTTQADTPRPSNPQELESVGESVEVSVYDGKNLFNNDTSLLKEVTYTSSSGAQGTRIGYEPLVLPSGTYTFTLKVLGTVTDNYIYGVINDKDGNYVAPCNLLADTNNRTPLTITVNEGDKIYIYDGNTSLSVSASTKRFNSVEIQLEVGSASPYEPYKAPTTYTINTPNGLKGIPVASGGNYTDSNGQQWITDEIDYDRGVYIQRIKKVVLNGSENWFRTAAYNNETEYVLCYTLPDIKDQGSNNGDVLCSHLPVGVVSTHYGTGDACYIMQRQFRMHITGVTTVAEAKDWLNSNNMTICYVLETPIETPITEELVEAYTHYPTTTILTDKAGLKVGYVADTKNYIDNKFAELQQAILSTGGNI